MGTPPRQPSRSAARGKDFFRHIACFLFLTGDVLSKRHTQGGAKRVRARTRPSRRLLVTGLAVAVLAAGFWARGRIAPSLRGLSHTLFRSRTEAKLAAREALLLRQIQGVDALISRAEKGPLVPLSGQRAAVIVDQRLVRSLLVALLPADYVIAERYRVHVTDAAVEFEDGLALIRLDGRASLVGVEGDVFADISVFGDLEVLRAQPTAKVLEARIKVMAVEARRVDLVVETRAPVDLVEELGKTELEAFAVLGSSLQIPVSQEHTFQVPAVGPRGPVRIEPASVPMRLSVLEVTALHGKLFISMAAGADDVRGTRTSWAPQLGAPPVPADEPGDHMAALERKHRERHERLEDLVADDPFLRQAIQVKGDLAMAVRADFALDVIREVAKRYLDRVDLRLGDIDVVRQGTLTKDTFLGRIRAGDWTASVSIHEVNGVLRAGAPEVSFLDGNRVALAFPVHLEQGQGRARLDFNWDSRGIANLVCRDFELTQEIDGTVTPDAYPVHGTFALAATGRSFIAKPAFSREFRIKLNLTPGSWDAVRARLREQDRFSKCGVAMDPEKVLAQLRELVGNGFNVRVPAHVFRSIELRAQVAESVTVAQREVAVAVTDNALYTSPDLLWYSAKIAVHPVDSVPERTADPARPPNPPLHAAHPAKGCAATRLSGRGKMSAGAKKRIG